MTLARKIVRFRQQGRHPFEPFVTELRDLPTDRAQQMLMMRDTARCFVALEAFTEITFHDESAAHQYVQRPVDCGGAGRGSLRA